MEKKILVIGLTTIAEENNLENMVKTLMKLWQKYIKLQWITKTIFLFK